LCWITNQTGFGRIEMTTRAVAPKTERARFRIGRIALSVFFTLAMLGAGAHLWASWEHHAAREANARRDFALAQKHLERALQVWFLSPEMHAQAARAARQAGHFDQARKHLQEGVGLAGHGDALDLEFMLLRAQQGDFSGVESTLATLLKQNRPGDNLAILEVVTPEYIQSFQLSSALDCIDRWLDYDPDSVDAWQYRVQVYGRLQNGSELLAACRRLLELAPDRDDVRLQFARELMHEHQPEEALRQFQQLRSGPGDTPGLSGQMARCLTELNRSDEARRLLDQVLARHPHDAAALTERGRLAMQSESPADAESWLRRAVAEAPADHDALYGLFLCVQKQGNQKEAGELQTKLKAVESDLIELRETMKQIAARPHDPEARYRAGVIFLRNGKSDEGLRWLTSALRENPGHHHTRQALAEYHDRLGNPGGAAQPATP
jgi:tetratricopeptide (TPR) repeat protein